MPDAHGNFKGMSVPAAAWEHIFGKPARIAKIVAEERETLDILAGQPNRDKPPVNK